MTLADSLKPVIAGIRAIPGQLGLRPYTVEIVNGVNLGTHTGDKRGAYLTTPIVEHGGYPPKVRQLTDEEIALAGLGAGLWKIGPITPHYSGATEGGTQLHNVLGKYLNTGDTQYIRLTGPAFPQGALFRIVKVGHDHAMHYDITVAPASNEV